MVRLREAAMDLIVAVPFAVTLAGAVNFLMAFPDPLPSFVDAANASKGVEQLLGKPIQRSLFWNGKTTAEQAVVSIPVRGPRGNGILHGRAIRQQDPGRTPPASWQFIALDVECNSSGKWVDILSELAPLNEAGVQSPALSAMAAAMASVHGESKVNPAQQHSAKTDV